MLNALAAVGYRVSSDLADRVRRSNISFICVPPTIRTGRFESSDVEEVYSRIQIHYLQWLIRMSIVFTHPLFQMTTLDDLFFIPNERGEQYLWNC